jgi:beta-lactamase class C
MKSFVFIPFVLFLGIAAVFSACGEASPNTPAFQEPVAAPAHRLEPALQELVDDYDRFFRDSMAVTQTPGAAVVVVKDSQVIFIKGYGLRCNGAPETVDQQTIFRIGSLSKGFAGVLTGILVQEGVLQWDEPVQKHYPEFTLKDKKQAQRIQLRHILSHTAGLPYHAYTNLIEMGYDVPTIIRDYFPRLPLNGKEGTLFSYQNVAICAIEEVMRGATGQSYQELLQEKIFQKAGMRRASLDYNSIRQLLQFCSGRWRQCQYRRYGRMAEGVTRTKTGHRAP